MSTRPQRIKLCRDLAMYFAEKGKIMTQQEYLDAADKPVSFSGVRSVGRSYSRAIEMVKKAHPDLLKMAEKKKEEAVKPVAPKVPKPAPKAAVKPAPAVKLDK